MIPVLEFLVAGSISAICLIAGVDFLIAGARGKFDAYIIRGLSVHAARNLGSQGIKLTSHPIEAVDAIMSPEEQLTVELLKSLEQDYWQVENDRVYFPLTVDYRLWINSIGVVARRALRTEQEFSTMTSLPAGDMRLLAKKVQQLIAEYNRKIFDEFNRKLLIEFRAAVAAANN